MNRRDVLAGLAVTAVAVAGSSRRPFAQQPTRTIGFLSSAAAGSTEPLVAAFREGLKETGYLEGRNVAIEFRWADGRYDTLHRLAADLVERKVAVILASGGVVSALAAKNATATIPVVFTAASDPVGSGLAASVNRPGGNVTGINALAAELDPKRLELLYQVVPQSGLTAVLVNANGPIVEQQAKEIMAAGQVVGREIQIVRAASEQELEPLFRSMRDMQAVALVVAADPFFTSVRERLVALAAEYKLPAMYQWREFAAAGGLMSYGASLQESYREAGIYVGRILNGADPATLPVRQPTTFQFVINLKTAKTLGLTVPPSVLARADEVIE